MINGLNVIGLCCIFTFILYLVKVLKKGPYISNFGKGDTSRIKKIYIIPANKVTSSGKAVMSQFKPKIINIRKGDTVEFINDDKIRHAIEIGNDKLHNSKVLFPGESYSVTIEEDGTIAYRSSLYPHIGNGFINVSSVNRSSSALKGTLGKFFGDNKPVKPKSKVESEGAVKTEAVKTEAVKTESQLGKNLNKNLEKVASMTKPIKRRLKRVIKSAFTVIGGIGPAIDSMLDVFDMCAEKGLMECIKHKKTRKIGLYLSIIIVLVIGGLYIYKNLVSSNLLLPVQMDGGI